MINSRQLLKTAGMLSFAVALFQVIVTAVPEWARYFGAWEAVASKLWLLYLSGFFVAIIFAVFGLYALSAAGYVRRLPLVRTGLVAIGTVYTLRGLFLVLEILINTGVLKSAGTIPARELVASSVSLIIGIIYLAGTIGYWKRMQSSIHQTIQN